MWVFLTLDFTDKREKLHFGSYTPSRDVSGYLGNEVNLFFFFLWFLSELPFTCFKARFPSSFFSYLFCMPYPPPSISADEKILKFTLKMKSEKTLLNPGCVASFFNHFYFPFFALITKPSASYWLIFLPRCIIGNLFFSVIFFTIVFPLIVTYRFLSFIRITENVASPNIDN